MKKLLQTLPVDQSLNLSYQFVEAEHSPLFVAPEPFSPQSLKIQDLPLTESCVDIHLSVQTVEKLLEQHPDWPGLILTARDQFVGMLSRHVFFEALGKSPALETAFKQTIFTFFKQHARCGLILDGCTSVQEAVRSALDRERPQMFDSLAVRLGEHQYGLLDMQVLLRAQADLLENLSGEVQQFSTRDPLTNLFNRRGFFEAARQTGPDNLSVLLIAIDDFNLVNDIYGRSVGDQVIQAVAAECQKVLQPADLLGRVGGVKFMALLPGASQAAACLVAESLRQKVESLVTYTGGYQVSVTVSLRVCHVADVNGSLDTLLALADQATHSAAAGGRNRVLAWNAESAGWVQNAPARVGTPGASWLWDAPVDASRLYDETIEGWAKALELRDKESRGHARRVTRMTLELARRVGVPEKDLVDIRRGALLHDIGKIAVPDHILFKPGPLTEEEMEVMRRHPAYAFELLGPVTYLQKSIDIPYCHHEHWDGSGYPRGLAGEQIPLAARIFTIIDVWDALTTDRCYHAAWQPEAVKKYIGEQAGRLFDPHIVGIFLEMQAEPAPEQRYDLVGSDIFSPLR